MGLPIRKISISDFRGLEGRRTIPLDAQIVLVHGPNGSGKTSVLSAIELALTGEVRSMRRQDSRYTAHLPTHGQDFATLRIDVDEALASGGEPITMTVGGSRIDGNAAFDQDAARFFSERCYLDQVSLGQLLDLYQYREGKEESALARFVNELLGLEQLDALRDGLSDAADIRLLRKLSESFASAEQAVQKAGTRLASSSGELMLARATSDRAQAALGVAMDRLGLEAPSQDEDVAGLVGVLRARVAQLEVDHKFFGRLVRDLTALGGQVEALSKFPGSRRLEEANAAVLASSTRHEVWRSENESRIQAWRAEFDLLELDASEGLDGALEHELRRVDGIETRQVELIGLISGLREDLGEQRSQLAVLQGQLESAQATAGALVEGLTALVEQAGDNRCPVCERDFNEVSTTHLTSHMRRRIATLSDQGQQMRRLREQRDAVAVLVQRGEQELARLDAAVLSDGARMSNSRRLNQVRALADGLRKLQPAIQSGAELEDQLRRSQAEAEEIAVQNAEIESVRSELERHAGSLGATHPSPTRPLRESWEELFNAATVRFREVDGLLTDSTLASSALIELQASQERVKVLQAAVADAAEFQFRYEAIVNEAVRRKDVAKAVRDAASKARATIVQEVFTDELNAVWRGVFRRLAPKEKYVPAFAIPSVKRSALELRIETVHESGESAGSPQMMLSAGNLNTAALSLFVAMHLAVEPVVPCLVFDDPVQAMDEVHVVQFAGLVRVLAKRHQRQVIIAVHERELFEYLALELSPAFEGDELITIQLGDRSRDEDQGVTRLEWETDPAIAV